MRKVSNKNIERYPPLNRGDEIEVLNSSIPVINGSKGVVVEADKRGRSPYKSLYKVRLEGDAGLGNPWYVFGNEVRKLN